MADFKSDLVEFLSTNISGKVVSGGKEFVCRCPICGDSRNLKSAHFYINLPNNDETPVMYHCKKCNTSGVLGRSILRDLGVEISDDDFLKDLIRRHKKLNGNFIRRSNKNRSIYKFPIVNNKISLDDNTTRKLKYINDRLGLNLSYQDILDCKIVLNLRDIYCEENKYVVRYTRNKDVLNELDESFIGFLGYSNGSINMRNLKDPKDYSKILNKRYVNYNLASPEEMEGTSKYYILPTIIDTLNIEPVKIHIAEGPFDILSIFYNVNNGNINNSIYASIEGKSYINLIKFLLSDLRIINAEIHVYIDNDVSKREISEITAQLQYLDMDIYYHWNRFITNNKYEKDYGVPKNRIIDYSEHIIKVK